VGEGRRWHKDPSVIAFLKTLGHPPT
jgi:hypothetical protein